ncbi:uncharacterized protein LOC134055854 [Cinclus cinclus]|uniref:uncharacterized protein LOC134055854 n=1 Tax=Cinclus cinclus TaxID=127875 RepID=UPI002E12B8E8
MAAGPAAAAARGRFPARPPPWPRVPPGPPRARTPLGGPPGPSRPDPALRALVAIGRGLRRLRALLGERQRPARPEEFRGFLPEELEMPLPPRRSRRGQ